MQLTYICLNLVSALLFVQHHDAGGKESAAILKQIQVFGNNPSALVLSAQGLCVLPDGSLLVSDKINYSIKKFDQRGDLILESGKRGKNKGEFRAGPGPIDCSGEIIAVADFAMPRIQIFSKDFEHRSTFFAAGPISDLKFDNGGNLWIGIVRLPNQNGKALLRYDLSGKILQEVSLRHTTGDMFEDVFSFSITPSGNLVIAYMVQNKIEVWNSDGEFQFEFSVPELPPKPKEHVLSKGGLFSKGFNVPEGKIFWCVTTDKSGNIFLLAADYTDNPNQDVYVFSSSGKFIGRFVLPEPSRYIRIDYENHIYTIENERTLIKKYQLKYK